MDKSRREDEADTKAMDTQEEPLLSFISGYFSFQNSNIFIYMVLSIIPAAICQLLYMKLDVLHIKGTIFTLFIQFNYTKYIPIKYDFIIQSLTVFFTLNLGLIGLKLIGWGLADEEKETIIWGFERFLIPGISILYLLVFIFTNPSLLWVFLPFFFLLYLLTKTSSKVVIFFTLLLLNLILFAFYYTHFEFAVLINEELDPMLTFMAKIGFSWLYILPLNFFIFFPLVIAVYFLNFKYPEKYISSFFDVVSHENMVAVFVGLLLNVTLSVIPLFIILVQPEIPFESGGIIEQIIIFFHRIFAQQEARGLRTFEIIAIFHFWIGSFTLWFTPFFVNFAQLESKFEANFDRNLREIIQKMKNHIVIIGFGNLGKKVCSDLIERDVVRRKGDTLEILTPDLEVKKICKSLLVVDVNDELFDRVHTDPILQNVGIARRKIRSADKKEDILIPAIIGDINSETTRDSSQLKISKLFISAPSDYRANFTLTKLANSQDLDSIISIEDSAQKDYFFPKVTAHDTFLIYPAFQEGISLGRIVSLCYFRLKKELMGKERDGKDPEIVIAGDGKQIHYLMETFWMEMEKANIAQNWIRKEDGNSNLNKKRVYNPPLTILTDSEEIEQHSLPKNKKGNKEKRKIEEIIKRSSYVDNFDAYLSVDVIFDSPDRLKVIDEIIQEKEPKIIAVTSKSIQNVSKIFHEWVVGVERYVSIGNKEYKPLIIVGVLGDEYEEIQDILLYYSQMEPESKLKYPVQYLDAAVRVYDNSKEKIGGLAQSFFRKGILKHKTKNKTKEIGKIREPFALYTCMEDFPGSLANVLGRLAGLEFSDIDSIDLEKIISLHFCRFQSCSGVENYSFLTNAELIEKNVYDREGKIACCLFQSESGNSTRKEEFRKSITNLLNVNDITKILNDDNKYFRIKNICPRCGRRITCSISSYLRKVENLTKNRDYYEHMEATGKLKPGTVEKELKRFFVNPDFHCIESSGEGYLDLPKATILVCCRHSKVTGSLSAAVNSLFFKKVDVAKSDNADIVDITYLRSYECYNPILTYVEFYGNWINPYENEREKILKNEGVIDSVFISVVTKRNAWLNYAENLHKALNQIYKEDKYELWVDNQENPNSIAIIRKDFIGKRIPKEDGSKELCFTCKKKECMIHDKIRLLKKRAG